MNPVNLNCVFAPKSTEKTSVSNNSPSPSIFTPAPSSSETAGSIASSASSSGSFGAVC